MQKKIIALAVAGLIAAPVFAQSSVTISGYVSQGIANVKVSGGTAPYTNIFLGNSYPGSVTSIYDSRYSRIRFAGTEDLGGGLKADFMIETRFTGDTAGFAGFAGGNDWVGLSGGFGSIKLGRIDKYYSDGVFNEISRANSFSSHGALSLLAWVEAAAPAGVGRWNNLIQYDTPRMSGFQATAAYSSNRAASDGNPNGTAPGQNPDKGDAWYLSGNYFNGPIYAGISAFDSDTEGSLTGAGSNGYRMYGSYTFPFGLKLGLSYDHAKIDAGAGVWVKRNAWLLPVTYSFGPHAVYASYGRAGKTKTSAGTLANSGATFYNLGYDYALSRRTSIGANYTVMKNKQNSSYHLFLAGTTDLGSTANIVAPGQKTSQLGLNIIHNF